MADVQLVRFVHHEVIGLWQHTAKAFSSVGYREINMGQDREVG